ncbi:hypothetical protein PFICI_02644 [Pestalotiopsis fici W106-1]|uniref:NmrA-like domain-containing protein n=1 Tax=Pestalotiopsis fici (strain W106-1 / CGMCC3.15140) TaxID=1229662 RepID=W3XF25_PESFW|nr:uncharacterized protein PFICI_02644 [Pestalotiopsis fici W106-1]ETS84619.1 hypothetical protein PFICI_02644 [Pestalotiopsis fici W106-1]
MVKAAIAGGSGGLGKAIVSAILATRTHEYIILSSRASPDDNTYTIDYDDIDGTKELLEAHQIETVISIIPLYTKDGFDSQLNLIQAAEQSNCTRRFIPSEFGLYIDTAQTDMHPSLLYKHETVHQLEKSKLEFACVHNGVFMDYLVWPQVPSHLQIQALWVSLAHKMAAIPGDGNNKLVLTHSSDVGRFVEALLGFHEWDQRYFISGDRTTLNRVVDTAEEILGCEFARVYDTPETLSRGNCTLLPPPPLSGTGIYQATVPGSVEYHIAQLGMSVVENMADLPPRTSLDQLFPSIRALSVRDAFQLWKDVK